MTTRDYFLTRISLLWTSVSIFSFGPARRDSFGYTNRRLSCRCDTIDVSLLLYYLVQSIQFYNCQHRNYYHIIYLFFLHRKMVKVLLFCVDHDKEEQQMRKDFQLKERLRHS